ncbi:MAG TPA: PilZ domain-containing protein [Pyrinomonadaceae bacterium]|nr:PilZ domain-containing protein [Pyrinomonadaceae bacterium]
MPEVIRSVVSRLRIFLKDRRQSPRLRIHLPLTVSIHRDGELNGSRKRPQTLSGYTRDISQKGLGLLVTQVHLDGYHLAAGGRELIICLDVDRVKPICMRVAPHRYERLDESIAGCTYLIGARIVNISDEDRLRYSSFLAENLRRPPKAENGFLPASKDKQKPALDLLE